MTVRLLFMIAAMGPGLLIAQSIAAGGSGPGVHYIDVDPDAYNAALPNNGTATYEIDLNGDGFLDLGIHVQNSSSQNFHNVVVWATGFGGTMFARDTGHCDTAPFARSFALDEVIDNSALWDTGLAYLNLIAYSFGQTTCDYNAFEQVGFMGVRITAGSDTLFGWLGVQSSYSNFTVLAYACGSIGNHIPAAQMYVTDHFFDISSSVLHLRSGVSTQGSCVLDVIDQCGRLVTEQHYVQQTPESTIDLSRLPTGPYWFTVHNDMRIESRGMFIVAADH